MCPGRTSSLAIWPTTPRCGQRSSSFPEAAGMAAARQQGLMRLDQVRYAVVGSDGKVSIIPEEDG